MDDVQFVHVKIRLPEPMSEPDAAARVVGIIAHGQTLGGQSPNLELIAFESKTGGVVAFDGVTPCPNACTPLTITMQLEDTGNGHFIERGGGAFGYEAEGDMGFATMLSYTLDAVRRAGHAHWVAVNLNDGMVV